MTSTADARPLRFTPALAARDPLAAYWLGQVHARLRRELAWAWHERGGGFIDGALPPFSDRAAQAVDLIRRWDEKLAFFASDPAASYLSDRIDEPEPEPPVAPARGSFSWVVDELGLAPLDCFWLAMALCGSVDAAVGSVVAAIANDPARSRATLALAQQLWDVPEAVTRLCDPGHPLHRAGLVVAGTSAHADWDAAASVPALVARRLLDGNGDAPASLVACRGDGRTPEQITELAGTAALLAASPADRLRAVPVHAPRGDAEAAALAVSGRLGRTLLRVRDEIAGAGREHLDGLAAWAWLAGVDLFLPESFVIDGRVLLPRESIPITVYIDAGESARRAAVPERLLAVHVQAPVPDHAARLATWTTALGPRAGGAEPALAECARRFRYGHTAITRIAAALAAGRGPVTIGELNAACRLELRLDLGDLAQELAPRFEPTELVLPPAAQRSFDEILRAMRALAEVHHEWGTARAWNAAGISVLFAGPSGTGKTMAAECLARALDLPIHRVDVSQVVDKYVGETEKNLKRVFDAAERGDCVLFLDEAESIFGKRMEARSAQDRWANLEVSYLLTRMESAKGLTILATNRKDDFDAAFLRRLRYVLDFPLPDVDARQRIWRQCIPAEVEAGEVNVDLVARRFPLTGGQIRSAVLNACLQSAGNGRRVLGMEAVVLAIWRELQKHDRTVALDLFGPHAGLIRSLERGHVANPHR